MNIFGIIMAGGGGTRFWPLSRQSMPKQLLNLSGNGALINETIDRISNFIDKSNIYIVTSEKQNGILREVVATNCCEEQILLEPAARNTAACIGYAAFEIIRKHGDGLMCIFPADHYIKDVDEFTRVMRKTIDAAMTMDKLFTIGIKPTFPSTGYGYIKYSNESRYSDFFEVEEFVEKPNFETAKSYLNNGRYLWNSGIFVWKASVIIENFKRFLPIIYKKLNNIYSADNYESIMDRLNLIYPTIPSISIDYGIMERSDEVYVINGDFGWSDIGSWDALGAIYDCDDNGNIIKGESVNIDSKNSIIYSDSRLIATIGIKDMIVVVTKDAVLVCPKEHSQKVKDVVNILKLEGKNEYID